MSLIAALVCDVLAVVGLWIVASKELDGEKDGYSKGHEKREFGVDNRFHVLVPLDESSSVAAQTLRAADHAGSVTGDATGIAVLSSSVPSHALGRVLQTAAKVSVIVAGGLTTHTRGDHHKDCNYTLHRSLPTKAPSLQVHYSMNGREVNG